LPIRFLHLQRWADQGWLHHIMHGRYMYGNSNQGWMTSFLFKKFLSIFKKLVFGEIFQSKTSPNSKWAWITCYIKSNCTSTRICSNMVTLQVHTSHVLQPLDVSCFKPFKTTFKEEKNNAMVKNNHCELNKCTLTS
jgi:hypothetical protein